MKQASPEKLKEGRLRMRELCCRVALEATPPQVTFIVIRHNLSGRAFTKTGSMHVPRPFTRKALYIFLHECAHFVLHSHTSKPKHVREMEAEKWAHERMRAAGLSVPRSMTQRAKEYVAHKIWQARKRGAKRIDPAAIKYAGL